MSVVPNAVPAAFVEQLTPDAEAAFERKRVLMLGSLKRYKGTQEFVALAEKLSHFQFELVLNETPENIDMFWKECGMTKPKNLTVYPRQQQVAPFYNRASVVLNLSNRQLFVETFGMTVLEAMSAGLPVIVPTVGGIAEMVEDGVNGYKLDVTALDDIAARITEILTDRSLYLQLSAGALSVASRYDSKKMVEEIGKIISD